MRNICNEEKNLKRYLKNHVSLNVETMVKFLITGMIGFSLTACGGGGGGSSSNATNPGEVNKNNETHVVTNSNSVITGTLNGTQDGFTALKAVNSTVENKATILVTGDGSIGIHGTTDTALFSARANHVVTNSGTISVSGHKSIGMLIENGVIGINKGEIRATSKAKDLIGIKEEVDEDGYKEIYKYYKTYDWVEGMRAQLGGEVQNTGKITINGLGTAMIAKGSKAVNDGTIKGKSGDQQYLLEEYDDEGNLCCLEEGVTREYIAGIIGYDQATIVNGINGEISLTGKVDGIFVENKSTALNQGVINLTSEEVSYIYKSKGYYNPETGIYDENKWTESEEKQWTEVVGMLADENSTVTNTGTINIYNSGIGMIAEDGSKAFNKGRIVMEIEGSDYNDSKGMEILRDSYGENSGLILIQSNLKNLYGYISGITCEEDSKVLNTGKIEIEGVRSSGIRAYGNGSIATNLGTINIDGANSYGMYAQLGATITNGTTGVINVTGDGEVIKDIYNNYYHSINAATGIESYGGDIYNSGNIVATGNGDYLEYEGDNGTIATSSKAAQGIYASNVGVVKNEGNIVVTGDGKDSWNGASGIYASGKYNYDPSTETSTYEKVNAENSGAINVVGNYATGIKIDNGDLINTGKIEVEGKDSTGINIFGTDSTAINNGIINIDGEGSYGMHAQYGATVTNGKTGIINVGASAAGGMYAEYGATAINDGTINIHKDNVGGENIALVGSGTLINNGTVTSNTNLSINTINAGAYVIGTSEDGSYGKITAKNVSIDGDVVVSAGITKNGFKNEYTMQNVVNAEDITLGDNFNFTSNSLLYDAETVTDRWGNLDATLSRNDKSLSDFTTGYITSTASIFGKYQNEELFKTLSSDAKEVIKAIDTTSVESINETLNDLTPTIYANLGRQILETSETFKEQDMVAINSLGENSYNFTFIGEYQDVDSRNSVEGYKSKMTGFVGAMNFGDGTFGTIGYGYNDVDYKDNGKGHIQTIHLGLNRLGKYEGVDYNFGIGGEYNFHENKRDIDLLGRKAESDFDSYGVRASAQVSKIFGKEVYIKPYLGLDLAHMKYDSFTESNANSLDANIESENYTSVLPKVGFVVGDKFGGLNLFAGVEYSYELGNMDKEQNFSYEGFEGTAKLPKDDLECGTTGIKAGASYEVNNFTLGASVGKNFGRRDNSFASLSLGYTF